MKEYMKDELDSQRDKLIFLMRNLGERLLAKSQRLKNDPSTLINSLGEVQQDGTVIDARCGAYCALQSVIQEMERQERKENNRPYPYSQEILKCHMDPTDQKKTHPIY
jgi:hypothetical protein